MLTFITGCMRSGKSSLFWECYKGIREIAPQNPDFFPDVFIPKCTFHREFVYFEGVISSISSSKLHVVDTLAPDTNKYSFIFVEEAELYDNPAGCIATVKMWLNKGCSVVVAGLRRNRFDVPYNEFTDWLLRNADQINVVHEATCDVPECAEEGYNSVILEENQENLLPINTVDYDGEVSYRIYCKKHYQERRDKLAL